MTEKCPKHWVSCLGVKFEVRSAQSLLLRACKEHVYFTFEKLTRCEHCHMKKGSTDAFFE